jgi:hypothetical protein
LSAFFADHGASRGTDLHICPSSRNTAPRFIAAHGLMVHGMVPVYRCCLPSTTIIASPSVYCL